MRIHTLVLGAATLALMTGPTFAGGISLGCKTYTQVTPDVAPVNRTGVKSTGVAAHNGTAQTIADFCPTAAAAGTCTGQSLSEPVTTNTYTYVTLDGDVPDIDWHRYGFYIKGHFIPVTKYKSGAC